MEETIPVEAPKEAAKPSPLVLAVLVVVVLTAAGLRARQAYLDWKPVLATATVNGRAFTVEVANTAKKREVGLGKRDSLPPDRGMYFPFDSAAYWVFWMKDMHFPIDIIWIRDGKVVDIDSSVPAPSSRNPLDLKTYSPVEPADAVLELNAGQAVALGIGKGDAVQLKALP
jgi:hypothetical protein